MKQKGSKHLRVAILGFGREGKAILKFLQTSPDYRGAEIVIFDQNKNVRTPRGSRAILGKDHLSWLHEFNLMFRSPGIPYLTPEIQHAIAEGAQCSGATQLFFEAVPCPVIGVTGTKGKGTTATLIYNILKAAGRDAHLVGNIGTPALTALPKFRKNSIVVFELSSFQLQDLAISPRTAVILDIFPDHMDAHGSFDEYREAKANIARHQRPRDHVFYFSDNVFAAQIADTGRGKKHPVSPTGFALFSPADLQIPGAHNFKNAVMAAEVCRAQNVSDDVILKAIKKFRGLKHRLELVRVIANNANREGNNANKGAVRFYDDSAGTNPQTAAAAVRAFTEPLMLIAGGKDKNLDYAPLRDAIAASPNVKLVVLIGENRDKISAALQRIKNKELRITERGTLRDAVRAAYQFAKRYTLTAKRSIVVFSPGAASFDMFKDYADRGEQFKKIVRKL
ncbi:MAG: UDP-N-acetylmuramoyl-L-alanine--D-glutamate ligase [Parcubacteria group bacterium]|nr:UDP-N-acetylmuramoyl-L-alanine--D-glutamate ligase [Parcubacteria group bacterium]